MSMNILIVDDSMLIRQVVKKVIRQVGLDVRNYAEASNGKEALEHLQNQEIDLVLSDINMPEMDGIDMLMHLRQMEKYQDLPVIMVSTEGSEERMNEAMELGASGYVLKPFTPERLADQLRPLGLMPEAGAQPSEEVDLSDPDAF